MLCCPCCCFCASSQMTGWRAALVPPLSWRSWLPILVYCCTPSGRIPRHAPLRRPPACFRFLSSGLSIALVSFSSCLICRPRKARHVAAYWCCIAARSLQYPTDVSVKYHHLTGTSLCQVSPRQQCAENLVHRTRVDYRCQLSRCRRTDSPSRMGDEPPPRRRGSAT